MLNAEKEHTEFGINPKQNVQMTADDIQKGVDTLIESAIKFLTELTSGQENQP